MESFEINDELDSNTHPSTSSSSSPPHLVQNSGNLVHSNLHHLHNSENLNHLIENEANLNANLNGMIENTLGASYRYAIGLKEREMIAKSAFKTWFRIKMGHKTIKDRWWALYYKGINPIYQLRDNHLGRLINQWIQEDLRSLRDNSINESEEQSMEVREHPIKKKKANSSREGNVPAYLHVELVHPSPHLLKASKSNEGYQEGSAEWHAWNLREHVVDGAIDWDEYQLEYETVWFRENRNEIMEKIPTLSGKNKNIGVVPSTKTSNSPTTVNTPRTKVPKETRKLNVKMENASWIMADIYQVENLLVVKLDLPNMNPNVDFIVQVDNYNNLIIEGVRKLIPESQCSILHSSRPQGKFKYEIELPEESTTRVMEQLYQYGVLSIKFALKPKDSNHWRPLPITEQPE